MKKALMFGFAAVVSMAMAAPAGEEKLGAGVTLKETTSIADVVKNPEAFVGKTIRIDGTATAVCQHMGCWMAVSASDKADAPTVRLKVEDGVIVFPVSAKGKAVSAQGVFEKIAATDAEGKEAAAEHAKHQAAAGGQQTAGHGAHQAAGHGAHQAAGQAEHQAGHDTASAKYQLRATGAIIK